MPSIVANKKSLLYLDTAKSKGSHCSEFSTKGTIRNVAGLKDNTVAVLDML